MGRPEVEGASPSSAVGLVGAECASESNDLATVGATPARTARAPKLYAIVRVDLPKGLQCAQVGHALIEWTSYYTPPDNLVVLQIANEEQLVALHARLLDFAKRDHSSKPVLFREPDLGGEATAIAAGPDAWKLLSHLRLLR